MKLGELFVDLGVNSGSALNSLTTFSIKFNSLAMMAEKVGDIFDNTFGKVANFGQQLANANRATGISVEWFQKMKWSAEQTGTSLETVISTIKGLQKANADILLGQGNIKPYQRLNIDMSFLRNPTQLLDEIMSKLMRYNHAFQQTLLSELGISEDILDLYKQKTINIHDSLGLTQQEVEELDDLKKEWVALRQTFSGMGYKFFAGLADEAKVAIKWVRELINGFIDLKNNKGWGEAIITGFEYIVSYVNNLGKNSKTMKFLSFFIDISKSYKMWEMVNSAVQRSMEGMHKFKEWDAVQSTSQSNKPVSQDDNKVFQLNKPVSPVSNKVINVTYNDNSQATINSSDEAGQFRKIIGEKRDKTQRQFSDLEILMNEN